jgi:hypothetical protein
MSLNPQDLQRMPDELEASRASRKRAWENLQELRWVLKDTAGMELPAPARKTIDLWTTSDFSYYWSVGTDAITPA